MSLVVTSKMVGVLILVPQFFPYGSFWSVPLGAVSKFGVLGLKRTRSEFNILDFFLSLFGTADAPALY